MIDFIESNKIYSSITSNTVQLYHYNGLDIPFDPNWKRVGINLSGGADSACLLLLLCDIITKNKFNCDIHVITHIRCYTTRPWQGPIAKDLYDKFVQEFLHINFYRHTNFIPPELEWGMLGPITTDEDGRPRSGDQICVGSFNNYVTQKENLDAVFNATSANPKDTNWPGAMKNREKPASEGVLKDLFLQKDQYTICHPFRFVDKRWIIAQYYLTNKIDFYQMTRSCEGDITHNNLKHYNNHKNMNLCGDCWWCKERAWAEDHLHETLKDLNHV
jgi:hypothetical protein